VVGLWHGLASARRAGDEPPPIRDVILVSIDTLRADHLGCYGYRAPTTPHIDAFRKDAVLFSQAIAACSATLVSHASMMTSLLPQQHGAEHTANHALSPRFLTVAELFRQHGYRTVSWNDGGEIAAAYGIDHGFDLYCSTHPTDRYHFWGDVRPALAWLAQPPPAPAKPLFVFLHTYEVHHPYTPDARYLAQMEPPYHGSLPADETPMRVLYALHDRRLHIGARDVAHIVATYDAEIRSMDEAFGALVAFLKRTGRYDDALIVFTADHGEEFGEHGFIGWHAHTLYDELLRVPLLIKFPDGRYAGETVTSQVRQIDIAPTLVAANGWPQPPQFRGADLTPLAAGGAATPRYAVSKLDSQPGTSIRLASWKLIDRRLYDLASDPGELHDVAAQHPDVAASLAARLQALIAELPAATGPEAKVGAEERARLRALGYLP
jgi:arylsulfatase A-like enzyme